MKITQQLKIKKMTIKNLENKITNILCDCKVKTTEELGTFTAKTHFDELIEDGQLRKLLKLGNVEMKRSGDGITILVTVVTKN